MKGTGRHDGAVYALAFSPDGRGPLHAGSDGVVCVWDVSQRRTEFRLTEHKRRDVARFQPRRPTTCLGQPPRRTVRLWDATTGGNYASFSQNIGEVLSSRLSSASGGAGDWHPGTASTNGAR